MKRLALMTSVVVATLAAVLAVWKMREAAVMLLLSIALAASVWPLVQRLTRSRVPAAAAVALVYGIGVALMVGAVMVLVGRVPAEMSRALVALQSAYGGLRTHFPAESAIARTLADRLPDPTRLLDGDGLGAFAAGALGVTLSAFDAGAELAIILVLSLLWSLSTQTIERLWLSLLPASHRSGARHFWQTLRDGVGLELRIQIIQSVLLALITGALFTALQMPCPLLVALAVSTLRFIPLVGPMLALGAVALGGESRGIVFAGLACATTLGLLVVLRRVAAERFAGARRLHPALLGVVLVALWTAGGIPAMFAAGPIAAALTVIGERLLAPDSLVSGTTLNDLRDRWTQLEGLLKASTAQRPELSRIVVRVERLIGEVSAR